MNPIRCFANFLIILSLAGCSNEKVNHQLLGQNNAVWSESIYLRGYQPTTKERLTEKKVRSYAENLKKHHIKYVFLFAGPYEASGHLPSYSFSDHAVNTVSLLRKFYPDLVVLPWVGGIQNKTVYLGDPAWVRNALADTKKMVETLGTPGVHIDLEYIMPGEPALDSMLTSEKPEGEDLYASNVNNFHRKLRQLLPKAFISSVVVATSPGTIPWKRKTTVSELQTLVKYIDQLSFLYYDTYIDDQQKFERNAEALIRDIQTLKKTKDIQYLISIGTFVNEFALQKYRDMAIENIPNSLTVIRNQIRKVNPSRKLVDGISIFCDWETSDKEWEQFDEHWSNY